MPDRPTARDETAVASDLTLDDLTFAVLDLPSGHGTFLSFKEGSTSLRLNSTFKQRIERECEDPQELCGTYARDSKGRPWLALTDRPAAVDQDVANVSERESCLEINSSQLSSLIAAHWAENGERKRLHWAGVREEMGPWTMWLLEDRDAED